MNSLRTIPARRRERKPLVGGRRTRPPAARHSPRMLECPSSDGRLLGLRASAPRGLPFGHHTLHSRRHESSPPDGSEPDHGLDGRGMYRSRTPLPSPPCSNVDTLGSGSDAGAPFGALATMKVRGGAGVSDARWNTSCAARHGAAAGELARGGAPTRFVSSPAAPIAVHLTCMSFDLSAEQGWGPVAP